MKNLNVKTLIIFNPLDSELEYVIVEGDFSRFHGVTINAVSGTGYEQEFGEWFWNNKGDKNFTTSTDKSLIENKQWDKVAIATFIP